MLGGVGLSDACLGLFQGFFDFFQCLEQFFVALVLWCGLFKAVYHCFDLSDVFLHKFVLRGLVFCQFLNHCLLGFSFVVWDGVVGGRSLQDADFFCQVVVGEIVIVVRFLVVSVGVVVELE